jgi:hypothetical protein
LSTLTRSTGGGAVRTLAVEGRVAVFGLHDMARELDPAEVGIVGVGDVDGIIADDLVGGEVAHLFDQVLRVECRLELAAIDTERDGISVHAARIGQRRLDHAVRRGPQRTQAIVDGARIRGHQVADLLPGEFAADDRDRALVRPDRLSPAAARRVLALGAHLDERHLRRLVVDPCVVDALHEARPALARLERLPEAEYVAAARELDGVEGRGSHGLGRRSEPIRLRMARRRQHDRHSGNRRPVYSHRLLPSELIVVRALA